MLLKRFDKIKKKKYYKINDIFIKDCSVIYIINHSEIFFFDNIKESYYLFILSL